MAGGNFVFISQHINGTSKGQTPAKCHTHLARSFSGDRDCDVAAKYNSKVILEHIFFYVILFLNYI